MEKSNCHVLTSDVFSLKTGNHPTLPQCGSEGSFTDGVLVTLNVNDDDDNVYISFTDFL